MPLLAPALTILLLAALYAAYRLNRRLNALRARVEGID